MPRILTEPPEDRSKFVSTRQGFSGHFAVIMWWNPDMGGFWEPYETGVGRYETYPEAAAEAKVIADQQGIGYLPSETGIV